MPLHSRLNYRRTFFRVSDIKELWIRLYGQNCSLVDKRETARFAKTGIAGQSLAKDGW
jgi:hypothetical protein